MDYDLKQAKGVPGPGKFFIIQTSMASAIRGPRNNPNSKKNKLKQPDQA